MPIYALGEVEPSIAAGAYVHPEAVIIGDVTVGTDATVWACAVLRGDGGRIVVGDGSSIQDGAVLHTTAEFPTVVGARCTIGHLAHLEGCRVLDGALVGSAAVVLHNAEIGEGALVGANAVVPGGMVVPPGAMALGVPAKIREDASDPGDIADGVDLYIDRGRRYAAELRRID